MSEPAPVARPTPARRPTNTFKDGTRPAPQLAVDQRRPIPPRRSSVGSTEGDDDAPLAGRKASLGERPTPLLSPPTKQPDAAASQPQLETTDATDATDKDAATAASNSDTVAVKANEFRCAQTDNIYELANKAGRLAGVTTGETETDIHGPPIKLLDGGPAGSTTTDVRPEEEDGAPPPLPPPPSADLRNSAFSTVTIAAAPTASTAPAASAATAEPLRFLPPKPSPGVAAVTATGASVPSRKADSPPPPVPPPLRRLHLPSNNTSQIVPAPDAAPPPPPRLAVCKAGAGSAPAPVEETPPPPPERVSVRTESGSGQPPSIPVQDEDIYEAPDPEAPQLYEESRHGRQSTAVDEDEYEMMDEGDMVPPKPGPSEDADAELYEALDEPPSTSSSTGGSPSHGGDAKDAAESLYGQPDDAIVSGAGAANGSIIGEGGEGGSGKGNGEGAGKGDGDGGKDGGSGMAGEDDSRVLSGSASPERSEKGGKGKDKTKGKEKKAVEKEKEKERKEREKREKEEKKQREKEKQKNKGKKKSKDTDDAAPVAAPAFAPAAVPPVDDAVAVTDSDDPKIVKRGSSNISIVGAAAINSKKTDSHTAELLELLEGIDPEQAPLTRVYASPTSKPTKQPFVILLHDKEEVDLLKIDGCPTGQWIARNVKGEIGFINCTDVNMSPANVKALMMGIPAPAKALATPEGVPLNIRGPAVNIPIGGSLKKPDVPKPFVKPEIPKPFRESMRENDTTNNADPEPSEYDNVAEILDDGEAEYETMDSVSLPPSSKTSTLQSNKTATLQSVKTGTLPKGMGLPAPHVGEEKLSERENMVPPRFTIEPEPGEDLYEAMTNVSLPPVRSSGPHPQLPSVAAAAADEDEPDEYEDMSTAKVPAQSMRANSYEQMCDAAVAAQMRVKTLLSPPPPAADSEDLYEAMSNVSMPTPPRLAAVAAAPAGAATDESEDLYEAMTSVNFPSAALAPKSFAPMPDEDEDLYETMSNVTLPPALPPANRTKLVAAAAAGGDDSEDQDEYEDMSTAGGPPPPAATRALPIVNKAATVARGTALPPLHTSNRPGTAAAVSSPANSKNISYSKPTSSSGAGDGDSDGQDEYEDMSSAVVPTPSLPPSAVRAMPVAVKAATIGRHAVLPALPTSNRLGAASSNVKPTTSSGGGGGGGGGGDSDDQDEYEDMSTAVAPSAAGEDLYEAMSNVNIPAAIARGSGGSGGGGNRSAQPPLPNIPAPSEECEDLYETMQGVVVPTQPQPQPQQTRQQPASAAAAAPAPTPMKRQGGPVPQPRRPSVAPVNDLYEEPNQALVAGAGASQGNGGDNDDCLYEAMAHVNNPLSTSPQGSQRGLPPTARAPQRTTAVAAPGTTPAICDDELYEQMS